MEYRFDGYRSGGRGPQAEIDAAEFHLFGLTRKHANWMLDSFIVFRKYEERETGEYRTKRLVLEVYDAMANAIEAGHEYQTQLDPPPADSTLAHGEPVPNAAVEA